MDEFELCVLASPRVLCQIGSEACDPESVKSKCLSVSVFRSLWKMIDFCGLSNGFHSLCSVHPIYKSNCFLWIDDCGLCSML